MSYSPATGLVYIPVTNTEAVYQSMPTEFKWGHWNTGVQLPVPPIIGMPTLTKKVLPKIFHGHLLAWNPVTQKVQRRVKHPVGANGGLLSTAGNLLFQGTSMAELIAASADTGAIKWRYNTQVGVIAAPVSYAIDGEKFIAVAAGWGGATGLAVRFDGRNQVPPNRILVFKLGANNTLTVGSNNFDLVAIPPRTIASSKELNNGLRLYAQHCTVWHGIAGISSKSIPDLRNLPIFFYENFNQVLLEGMMESAGMPSFNGV